jgi:serine/threonine-protein kinase HipA
MKKITVCADFDFLSTPQEIGTLGYEHVHGKDHFVFEYSREWLKQYSGILLSGDLMNVPSLQHPRGNDNVFGFVTARRMTSRKSETCISPSCPSSVRK